MNMDTYSSGVGCRSAEQHPVQGSIVTRYVPCNSAGHVLGVQVRSSYCMGRMSASYGSIWDWMPLLTGRTDRVSNFGNQQDHGSDRSNTYRGW